MNTALREDQSQHLKEMLENQKCWDRKTLLRKAYDDFYTLIKAHLTIQVNGLDVEVGSGLGHFRAHHPSCILTDIFPNPWIDQVENAYSMSFADGEVSNLILFDVFHHLEYPGTALAEFERVLAPGGRLIIFDPCMSLLGLGVFGVAHHEPIGITNPITWRAPDDFNHVDAPYYAAQGNAYRAFVGTTYQDNYANWNKVACKRFSAFSYLMSGGYRGPQLCPSFMYPVMKGADCVCSLLPILFATRLLVVLEKKA